jgi:dipeptidyl aminopeptidase/acylaminoacyl peptidase
MWIWGSDGGTVFRYAVDLDKERVGPETTFRTPANQAPDCAKPRVERKKRDAEVYGRIVERLKNQRGAANVDSNLPQIVQWIEESTKAGYSRENWIVASPDGAYAVFVARDKPLLLIDIATLSTRVLAQPHADLTTPAAWSPDSRLLAFAPPDTDKIQIYSVKELRIISTKTGAGPWAGALSWSPDMERIAVFGFHNRRMNKTPLGLLGAVAGHPEFRNDGILTVYRLGDEAGLSLVLKRGISEWGSPNVEIEWK